MYVNQIMRLNSEKEKLQQEYLSSCSFDEKRIITGSKFNQAVALFSEFFESAKKNSDYLVIFFAC